MWHTFPIEYVQKVLNKLKILIDDFVLPNGADVLCFLSSLPTCHLPPAITAVFGSYLSFLYTRTSTVSPVRACLSIRWERFRGTQKEDERGHLSIQSTLLLSLTTYIGE
jgi:hypothetical protein